MKKCLYCNNEFKDLGYSGHLRFCKENPNREITSKNKGKIPWNKGLKLDGIEIKYGKETSERIRNGAIKAGINAKGISNDPNKERERKEKISRTMKKNPNSGGYRKGSGRGKSGWYKGIWCDSSWELAWVIYSLDNNIQFSRNWEKFKYTINGKERNYTPDFLVNEIYQEIKGRRNFSNLDEENKQKILQFTKPLNVLYENEMKPILDYVIKKYGKNYIKLYQHGE